MENQNFYLKTVGGLTAVILAATALITNFNSKGLTAAVLTAVGAGLIRSAERKSRKTGRTDSMKTTLRALRPGTEIILISAGLLSYGPATAVSVTVLGLVTFSEILVRSVDDVEEFFGQEIRVTLLFLAFLGLVFNPYVLFYGLLALGLVAGFDSLYILYRSFESSV